MFILIFRRKDFGRRTEYAVTAFRVVMDVYIICLPLVVVSRLHISRLKKWRVAAVFATGLLYASGYLNELSKHISFRLG
jgi:hypothetical protein